VGFDLYTRMLARVVRELKAAREGRRLPPDALGSIRIDLHIPVRLPEEYVPDVSLRLKMYRRLADLDSKAQIAEMARELADRFGPLPVPTQNLMYQLHLKVLARQAGVGTVAVENGRFRLGSGRGNYPDIDGLRRALGDSAKVSRRDIWLPFEDGWREELVAVLERMASLAS
jgi:transcription-repair coupling factor (superfamily II helicase)